MQTLRVFVVSAKNLLRIKGTSRYGCYVTVEFLGEKKSTATQDENLCNWNEALVTNITILDFKLDKEIKPKSPISFMIKRSSCIPLRIRNKIIAWGAVQFENAVEAAQTSSQMYELTLADKYNRRTHGILQLKFKLDDTVALGSDVIVEKKSKESGYFVIDVCRAEGLPRMDLGNIFAFRAINQKLVDGYLVLSFADEQVTTSVIKQNTDPVWNERLYLPFNLPLENHYLKLDLKDEDIITADDLISTSKIPVKDITPQWQDVRQMPCFGPSFVNFYGASRLFRLMTTNEMQQMNCGKEEGCAFRGRVLLALSTQLGKIPEDSETVVPQIMISKSLPLPSSGLMLKVVFMDCFLLRTKEITTLEVSIGLYGDSQINSIQYERPSCVPSFVPASRKELIPQFYAPWSPTEKPCVVYEFNLQGNLKRVERSNCFKHLIKITEIFLNEISTPNTSSMTRMQIIQNATRFAKQFLTVFNKLNNLFRQQIDTDLDRHMHQILLRLFKVCEGCLSELLNEQQELIDNQETKILLENQSERVMEILTYLKSIPPIDQPNEYPDVFIWLYSDWRRKAYCRVPISDIIYSEINECRGEMCDETRSWKLKFPFEITSSPDCRRPGILRASLWFGAKDHALHCFKTDNDFTYVFKDDTPKSQNNNSKWTGKFPKWKWTKMLTEKSPATNSRQAEKEKISKAEEKSSKKDHESLKLQVQMNDTTLNVVKSELPKENTSNKQAINLTQNSSKRASAAVPIKFKKHKFKHNTFHFPLPCLYQHFKESHPFELRCYIYQAKELLSGDKTGFSDPFVRVSFLTSVAQSRHISESLCPIWEQTLILSDIILPGPLNAVDRYPPQVLIEVYDKDDAGAEEYLGKVDFFPLMGPLLNRNSDFFRWFPIMMLEQPAGELLTCAELILKESNYKEYSTVDEIIPIPKEMEPKVVSTILEIVCIGLRVYNISKPPPRPSIEFYYNKTQPFATTDEIQRFPIESNFKNNYFKIQLLLPEEGKFMPSLTLRLKQRGSFNQISIAGVCIITNLQQFLSAEANPLNELTPSTNREQPLENQETDADKIPLKTLDELLEDLDWWSKYHASKGDLLKCGEYITKGFRPIKVFPHELEEEEIFKRAIDKIKSYPIYKGKNIPGSGSSRELVADLKIALEIRRPSSEEHEEHKKRSPLSFLSEHVTTMSPQYHLRLYLIRAYNLPIKDFRSSDPFIRVKIGTRDEEEIPNSLRHNNLNPVFGCLYETTIVWSIDSEILIEVVDKDLVSGDDLIGATIINIDDRLLAPCRASCGVSPQIMKSGPYVWRDCKPPSEILRLLCSINGVSINENPQEKKIEVNGVEYFLTNSDMNEIARLQPVIGSAEEILALKVLRQLNFIIKEHIETRSLYHPSHPGIRQGQLEMWMDVLPIRENIPLTNAVDIAPRIPKTYELRCVIYNAYNVILDDKSLLGDRMSDVFIKGWLLGMESEWQKTDVHHRSLNGEANFNWRFVFPFKFLHGENVILHQTREHFLDVHLTEVANPPTLCLQICDYDTFSRDDVLGTLHLDLMALIPPHKQRSSQQTSTKRSNTSLRKKLKRKLKEIPIFQSKRLSRYKSKFKYYFTPLDQKPTPLELPIINMFKQKWVRGFWFCPTKDSSPKHAAGEIEMELEILSEEEAKVKKAGRGRDEPNANPRLEVPIRPYTSFSWLSSPLKFLKYMCCVRLRLQLIVIGIVLVTFFFLYIFFRKFLEKKIGNSLAG